LGCLSRPLGFAAKVHGVGGLAPRLFDKIPYLMIILTKKGLYCEPGRFYIDPSGAVEHAVVTHAHSDHARKGSQQYYSTASGLSLLKVRLGQKIAARGFSYGEKFRINDVQISFHPAGHILGSAQVRIEWAGEVWVCSGDYKRDPDPTCEPFETVPCDVFITEATFGTPGYAWEKGADLGKDIFEWWQKNAARGVNSVLFAYSLGKAQRVLGALHPHARGPVYCHPAARELNDCYRAQGIQLAPTVCLSSLQSDEPLKGELVLVPQAFLKSDQGRILGDRYETAFASGWMAKGRGGFHGGYDHGFVMSDHADWNDLVRTVVESRARRVYVQHRGNGALVRHLRQLGLHAFPDTELVAAPTGQMALF
jgi:putative mRNA 3-end processing factor